MSGHGEKRSRLEEAAIGALLGCPTIEAAAELAGIAPSTLRRWLGDTDFQQRYRQARRQLLDQAAGRLHHAAGSAVTTLVAIAEDQTAPPAARVSAARTLLDQAFHVLELLDLAERVEQLEQAAAAAEGKEG